MIPRRNDQSREYSGGSSLLFFSLAWRTAAPKPSAPFTSSLSDYIAECYAPYSITIPSINQIKGMGCLPPFTVPVPVHDDWIRRPVAAELSFFFFIRWNAPLSSLLNPLANQIMEGKPQCHYPSSYVEQTQSSVPLTVIAPSMPLAQGQLLESANKLLLSLIAVVAG